MPVRTFRAPRWFRCRASTAHDFSADCAAKEAVIFHCQSGARTSMNARRLVRAGFRDVFVLSGGIVAWKRAGLPTAAG